MENNGHYIIMINYVQLQYADWIIKINYLEGILCKWTGNRKRPWSFLIFSRHMLAFQQSARPNNKWNLQPLNAVRDMSTGKSQS